MAVLVGEVEQRLDGFGQIHCREGLAGRRSDYGCSKKEPWTSHWWAPVGVNYFGREPYVR